MERFLVPELPDLIPEGRAAMWVRVPGWPIGSPASQGFVADIIPMALGLAIGQGPGGTSLDNTVRVVLAEPTDDWILLDIEAEGMNRSIGCGRVRLWRRDGTLIGVGTQIGDRPHQPPPDLRAGAARVACTACASPRSTTSSSTSPTPRSPSPGGTTCSDSSRCAWRSGGAARSRSCRSASTTARSSTCSSRRARARTSTTWRSTSTDVDLDELATAGTFDVVRGPLDVFGARGQGRGLYVRDPDGNVDRAAHLPFLTRPTKGDHWTRSRASSPSSPAAAPAWVAS